MLSTSCTALARGLLRPACAAPLGRLFATQSTEETLKQDPRTQAPKEQARGRGIRPARPAACLRCPAATHHPTLRFLRPCPATVLCPFSPCPCLPNRITHPLKAHATDEATKESIRSAAEGDVKGAAKVREAVRGGGPLHSHVTEAPTSSWQWPMPTALADAGEQCPGLRHGGSALDAPARAPPQYTPPPTHTLTQSVADMAKEAASGAKESAK